MAGYIGPAPVPQATQNREAFTATSGQTSFATAGYTPQFIDVYLNGVKLAAADYTATNGSDVVLASGAASGDILEVVAFSAFTVADQTFTGTTTAANLTVTGAFTSQGIDDNADAVAITIDSSENVGIGTSSPNAKLDVRGAIRLGTTVPDVADGGRPIIYASDGTGSHTGHALVVQARDGAGSEIDFVTGTTPTTRMHIGSSGNVGIGTDSPAELLNLSAAEPVIRFTDSDDNNYHHLFSSSDDFYISADRNNTGSGNLIFRNGGTSERMRLDASGNLLVGTTTTDTATVTGVTFQPDGQIFAGASNQQVATFSRQDSDGEIVRLRKGSTTVGSIGTRSGSIGIGNGDVGLEFNASNNDIYPKNVTTNSLSDANIDLGSGSYRFKDLYLSGGVFLGGTGSANKLDDYEVGTWTPGFQIDNNTTGITYSTRSGSYVKVGKLIFVEGDIQLSSKGSNSGSVKIEGLPFTIYDRTGGTSLDGGASLCAFQGGTNGIYSPIGLVGNGGSTNIQMYIATSSGANISSTLTNTKITGSFSIRFSLTYRIA